MSMPVTRAMKQGECRSGRGRRGGRGRPYVRGAAGATTGAPARRLRAAADHGRTRRAEHERAAGQGQLHARGARRPALLRQRSQRPALHPRQADEEVHRLPRFQRARRTARPVPEVHLRAQLRHRPHQLPVRSRLRAQRRLLHDAHGRPVGAGRAGAEARRRRWPRSLRVHDHAGDSDADGRREDRARGGADRVEGSQPGQRDLRGHGARADAAAASAAAAPAGRDDLQSRRAARRSRLAGDVHRRRRFRLGRPARQPPHQPAAARHARRQDPAHRARPARAHGDEHGQRERPLPDPQRQSVRDPRGRSQGDLGLRPAQSASADLGRRSGAAEGAAPAGVPHRAAVVGDGRRHPQGRELRLAAARRHAGAVARRHGPDPAGRHDSDPDFGHRHARHGQADLSGAAVPAPAGRRRRHRQRVHLSRQADPRAEGQARVRRHHRRPDLVRRACRAARGRRREPGDGGADSRDGHGPARPGGAGVSRARRQGRGAARRRPDLRPRARGLALRGRRRRRALHPDEA